MSPPPVLATRRPFWTGMVVLTGKLAWPMLATRLKADQPIQTSAIGTPIASVTQRPGVMRRSAGGRGGLVTGPVVGQGRHGVSPFPQVPR